MVRLAILLVLVLLTIWEWRRGPRKAVYWLTLAGLFVFFSLRYGQGTDYITYMSIYATVPPLSTLPSYTAYTYNNIEIGFFYLVSLFRMLGVHYVLFVAIVTGVSLLLINRAIGRFSPLPMFALTFFFAVYSIHYMESGIRQLLSLSIAVGWVYVDWMDGRRGRAMVGALLAVLLHTSALVLIALPVLFWNPRPLYIIEWKAKKSAIVVGALLVVAAVINFVNLEPLIQLLPAQLEYRVLSYYTENASISLLAFANRALFMALAFGLAYRAKEELSGGEKLLFNLYCVGFALYLLLLSFDLMASRLNVYFRIVEFVLLPMLFFKNKDLVRRTVVGMPVMLMLLSFLYVKDITATMDFAQYYESNPLKYPYITIFNADSIYDQKFVNVKNAVALNAYQAGGMSWDEYYDSLMRKPSVRSPIVPY